MIREQSEVSMNRKHTVQGSPPSPKSKTTAGLDLLSLWHIQSKLGVQMCPKRPSYCPAVKSYRKWKL